MQSFIGQIGIFMICAQAILHFRPKESYGKYLRLLFSVMILIQIFQPVSSLFFGGSGVELQRSVQQFQEHLDESMEQAVKNAAASEEYLEQMSLEELQKRQEADSGELQTKEVSKEGEQEKHIEEIEIEEIRITREDE